MARHQAGRNRRRFLQGGLVAAGLAVLSGCGSVRLPWQAGPKIPRIGVLLATGDPGDADSTALREGLRDLGYVEGQTVALEWRYPGSGGKSIAEMARMPVDLIVAAGTGGNLAAKRATATIPIVMTYSSDPVRSGFVASLARPGGNLTGMAALTGPLSGKRLELLKQAVPGLVRVAMLWNPESAERAHEFEETAEGAEALGLRLESVELRQRVGLEAAFAQIAQRRAEALFLQTNQVSIPIKSEIMAFATEQRLPSGLVTTASPVFSFLAPRIVAWAARQRLPAMYAISPFADAGGLLVYAASLSGNYRHAAAYVAKILKGAKPGDLPVEKPATFDFVVNLKTAQAQGLMIPPSILQQATRVIQ